MTITHADSIYTQTPITLQLHDGTELIVLRDEYGGVGANYLVTPKQKLSYHDIVGFSNGVNWGQGQGGGKDHPKNPNYPHTPIPEPGTAVVATAGLMLVLIAKWKGFRWTQE